MWQEIIVAVLISASVAFIILRYRKIFKRTQGAETGCSGDCSACTNTDSASPWRR